MIFQVDEPGLQALGFKRRAHQGSPQANESKAHEELKNENESHRLEVHGQSPSRPYVCN